MRIACELPLGPVYLHRSMSLTQAHTGTYHHIHIPREEIITLPYLFKIPLFAALHQESYACTLANGPPKKMSSSSTRSVDIAITTVPDLPTATPKLRLDCRRCRFASWDERRHPNVPRRGGWTTRHPYPSWHPGTAVQQRQAERNCCMPS